MNQQILAVLFAALLFSGNSLLGIEIDDTFNWEQYRQKTAVKKVFAESVHFIDGKVTNARHILVDDGMSTRLDYPVGGSRPELILDMGPGSVGGYPIFKVTAKEGQPVLRIAYGNWYPYLVDPTYGDKGDCIRRYNDTYLGVDLPVLPGNPDRYELDQPSNE